MSSVHMHKLTLDAVVENTGLSHTTVFVCLQLKELSVPSVVVKGSSVWLNCSYDLEKDKLYSVKWHKDNVEFYRYLLENSPPGQKYELPGIYLDLHRSYEGYIHLYKTDVDSEGIYRCEVSAEAPSFQTVKGEKELRIYVFPSENPKILGTRTHYQVGDEVNATCVSAPSRPAAILKWYINGDEAQEHCLIRSQPAESLDGLFTSSLGLRFISRSIYYWDGTMKLKCEAIISQAHTLSSEEILISTNTTAARIVSDSTNDGPTIRGGRTKYQVGDIVEVNCSASKSQPPAELHWYINDKEVNSAYLMSLPPIRDTDGLESTVLGLRFKVKQRHFQKGEMRLRCTATLSEVVRMSSEELEVDYKRQVSDLHAYENAEVSGKSWSRRSAASIQFWSLVLFTTLISG